ncbi:carbohydrate ABC transporter permease [Spirochaeta isovalerica]|uniref:Raffinose/stachyose/melibiose transport system permease protein n=1 Tax=Spirochaeta isovalerica TaxID=150 RepID=A0A841R481_9SPIO|nr:sugar ABC transporter permease [Spirochaeta isovalerica]MBB6479914.1 raffinose/stachyose/melibiose transport system permease protein [Spirochaeta isovalerica]
MISKRKAGATQNLLMFVLFIAPALILFSVFVVAPVFQGAFYSLFNWKGAGPLNRDNFAGVENFTRLFADKYFKTALWNNMKVIIFSLIFQLPAAFIFALLIGRGKSRGSVLFRSLYFFPYILTEIIAGVIWKFIYNPQFGLMTQLATFFADAKTEIALLADPSTAFNAIFVVLFWKYIGFHMILYIAGLQNVPSELEDAAVIDGANRLQVIWNVIIPSMKNVISISIFLSVTGAFNVFDVVWAMGQGGPVHSTETLVTYLYNFGYKRFAFGYGSAVAIVIFLLCLAFNFLYQRFIVGEEN